MAQQTKNKKVATALKYSAGKDTAPKLIAKGAGHVAEKIVEKAEESGVPVYEDPLLANQLANLAIGQEIPAELYHVVAEVLIFISRMDQQAKQRNY